MLSINVSGVDRLIDAMQKYTSNLEDNINEVLHNEAGQLISTEVKSLMPTSNAHWKGKKPAAKSSNSLTQEIDNLSVTIKNTKNYAYLYFPNDGTNTRRHVGNQQFFARGAENVTNDIIDVIVNKLVNNFE